MSDSKSLSQQRFGQHAAGYVTNRGHAQGGELERLVELAQPQPDWVVLDVATGGGHTALKFAPYVRQVIASDLTPAMLEQAEKHIASQGIHNVIFRQADAEALPFDDASFDLVTCRIAPHHFPQVERFVQESVRTLRPGGLLLVQDQVSPPDDDAACYTDAFEKLRDPSHYRVYSEPEWIALFQAAGLTVLHTEQIIKRHDLVHWSQMQGGGPVDVARLQVLLKVAPPLAAEWMQPQQVGTPQASFANHHLIILGRKSDA
jgi:ubiquinone/menaquinone biosynthesis C-methylase UbiE